MLETAETPLGPDVLQYFWPATESQSQAQLEWLSTLKAEQVMVMVSPA